MSASPMIVREPQSCWAVRGDKYAFLLTKAQTSTMHRLGVSILTVLMNAHESTLINDDKVVLGGRSIQNALNI